MVSLKSIGGELMKPGGAGRLMGQGAFWLGNQIGKAFAGDRQASTTTTPIQPTQKKQIQTYNSRYPGFDENDYLRLEQIVDGFGESGSKKAQLMDEAYQYYYPQVLNKHKLDERQEMINNRVYENGEKLANGDKLTNLQYRALNLTQMAKEKFDIAYNVNDEEILQNLKEKVPNGDELLSKFLKDGDPEILYASGIYDKGQEAQDFRSQKNIANEVLGGNFWKNAWANMYANSFAPLDSAEKFLYKGIKNMQMLGTKIDDYFADKDIPEWLRQDAFGDKTAEEIRAENQQFRDRSRNEIDDYIDLVNKANQTNRERTVNPIVDNYYNRRNFTDLLAEGDIDGFFYKGLGDAASNWDMPVIIGTSIINPAMGTALMGTNSYVRESEEAYETMRKAGATHEQAEAGGAVVGLINSAIEVYLDKLLGGTETTTTKGVRDAIKKNVMREVSSKPFEEIVSSATKTYVGSSLEEGLEEWLQNIVTNAAEMTVKENPERKDLFEGGRAAAEGGIFNPFNILAPGGDIARNTDINSIKQGVNGVIDNIGKGVETVGDTNILEGTIGKSDLITRDYPIWQANRNSGLTPSQKARVKSSGYSIGEVLLKNDLAGKSREEQISGLQDKTNEYIETKTKGLESIPENVKVDNTDGSYIATTLANDIEKMDTKKMRYPGLVEGLKDLAKQKELHPLVLWRLIQTADILENIYKNSGEVKDQSKAQDLNYWRMNATEKLNEVAKPYNLDLNELNADIRSTIEARDSLIEQWVKEDGKNMIKLRNLMISYLINGTNPVGTLALLGGMSVADKTSGNLAQKLYNLNKQPLERQQSPKKGAGFNTNSKNNGNGIDKLYNLINTSNVPGEMTVDVSNLDVGANPMDIIKDKNVGESPTDVVETTDTSKSATKKSTKKTTTKKGKKGDVKWYADEAYSPEIVMTEEEINKWEEKNGTNDTDKISLKRDLIDKLMKKGNYGEKVKVIIRKNGEMAGTHTIEKFQGDGKTYYNIDVGTPDWKVFDVKDMKNWLINNDTVYAEMGGEKYTTPEYSKWEEERNAQIEKEREESGIAEQERKISNNLLSKIGDKGTIERFKDYFKGELAKNGGKYDMYKDILAFLEGKKTVDDFVEGEIVINDFPNSVMKEIRENLGLNAISIKNLHSMIKEYGKNKNKSGNKTKQYADNSYKPSITMTEKSISKKQAKENVNNLISDTWSDIGDEGDWGWYKKMKKKDVITYLEDQVLDEYRRSNYGLEWSEVQKLIKKFVNQKMK